MRMHKKNSFTKFIMILKNRNMILKNRIMIITFHIGDFILFDQRAIRMVTIFKNMALEYYRLHDSEKT